MNSVIMIYYSTLYFRYMVIKMWRYHFYVNICLNYLKKLDFQSVS